MEISVTEYGALYGIVEAAKNLRSGKAGFQNNGTGITCKELDDALVVLELVKPSQSQHNAFPQGRWTR